MLSIAYFSLLIIFCKIGYMFFPTQVHIFFQGKIVNVCSVCVYWLSPPGAKTCIQ
jgi:hypothetical protein